MANLTDDELKRVRLARRLARHCLYLVIALGVVVLGIFALGIYIQVTGVVPWK